MYSPTMRLLAVLELMETYGSISGREMARRLEVDARTIRRYIVTLQDMGIPIAAERGPYGAYRLERGSRLPPLIFNNSEASAIILGLLAMRQMHFPLDAAAVEGALAKTERLLPTKLLGYVNDVKNHIKIHSDSYSSAARMVHGDFVQLLNHAVRKHRRAVLTYSSSSGATTVREVDVYGLVLVASQWYAAGYCHLREGLRTFRVDRILAIETSETVFDRPADFDLLNFVLSSIEPLQESFEVEILLETTIEQARGILASETHLLEAVDGGVLYRLSTSRLDWVALGLLSSDLRFAIRKPPELFEVFRVISERAARIATAN